MGRGAPSRPNKLVTTFMKNKEERLSWGEEQLMASEDVDKTQAGPIPMMRSKDTVNQYLKAASAAAAAAAAAGSSGGARLTSIEEQDNGDSSSNNCYSEEAAAAATAASTTHPSEEKTLNKTFPDLGFLQDDAGLWDAFFLHSRNASKFHSVLAEPAIVPSQPSNAFSHIRDSESLRLLLPADHQHLLPSSTSAAAASHRPNSHDLQNEAIKNMFVAKEKGEEEVKMVRVREAWADVPEKETVVVRRRRDREDKESKLANRRSFQPQEHLGKMLEVANGRTGRSRRSRAANFPKVSERTRTWPDSQFPSFATLPPTSARCCSVTYFVQVAWLDSPAGSWLIQPGFDCPSEAPAGRFFPVDCLSSMAPLSVW